MFILTILFFLINSNIIYCLKNEIKFYINNVPSLFRCEKNGALFYFNHFPINNEFNNIPCDLSLSSINQYIIIELNKLELLCEILYKKKYINEFIFFSIKCSKDLCQKFLPLSAKIITEYNTKDINIDRIDLIFNINSSTQSIIGQLTNDKYLSLKIGDIRTHQIIFQYEENNYFNMMFIFWYSYMVNLKASIGICHRYFWSQTTMIKTDWSWICYYYPTETENPLDHNMIYRAVNVEEFENTNPKSTRILLRKFENNSSSLFNRTNIDLSKNSISLLLFLILLISICGICYFGRKKSNIVNRSSEESCYSQETLEETFIE